MSYRSASLAVVVGVFLFGAARTHGQDKLPAEAQKSADAVMAHLEELKGGYAQLLFKEEATLKKIFPDHQFIVARYRQFPVARKLPEGLAASNVFAVAVKNQKLQHVKDVKGLERFFKDHQVAAGDEATAKASLAAWLALAQEFRQDGFYKFETLYKEFSCENNESIRTVSGRALVTQGGKGELAAMLTYESGKLTRATETGKIMPGPRPICQATKLLDRDPIVRKMAEQDLLFMGLPARDYLMEQHEKAGPELQRAIDRLWRQIRANGW
jgi:hypothetical protein